MKYKKSEAKEYARENMRGIWAAALTPFTPSLEIDEIGFRQNIRHWVDDLEAFLSYDMIRGDVGIAGNTILVSGAKGGPGP